MRKNLDILIQETDAISTELEDLAINSKTERVDISEIPTSLREIFRFL